LTSFLIASSSLCNESTSPCCQFISPSLTTIFFLGVLRVQHCIHQTMYLSILITKTRINKHHYQIIILVQCNMRNLYNKHNSIF
jgi:hypothetical protein